MAQIGTIKLETQNSGTVSVPVFATGDSGSSVHEFLRVQTAGGTGFIPLVAPADASFPYLRVQSQNHGVVAAHNEATLFAAGTKFYLGGNDTDSIYQYSASTAYDISTLTLDKSKDISSEDNQPGDLTWNTDGTKLFMLGFGGKNIYTYDLTTAYDIGTASLSSTQDATLDSPDPEGFSWNSDGTKLYISDNNANDIVEYAASTAFDPTTISSNSSPLDVSNQTSSPTGQSWNTDGTRFFLAERSSNNVYQYNLSTAFDISTATLDTSVSVNSGTGSSLYGLDFQIDGSQFWATDLGDIVHEFTMSTAFDVGTASLDQTFDASGEDTLPLDGKWKGTPQYHG